MSTIARTVARAGLLGGLAIITATVTATSARAASEEAEFSCEFGIGDTVTTTGSATASFDTGIADGLVVDVGTRVSLNPFTGSVTLPEGFVTMLRGAGLTSIQGGGETNLFVDPAGDELFASFGFGPTELPAEGPVTLDLDGEADRFRPQDPGTQTILLFDFGLFVDTGDPEGPGAGMFCESADGQDVAIDALQATAAVTPAPTTTVTTTATPVRPVVVQTDFAHEDSTAFPLGLGAGILALSGAAAALARTARRSASRRH
jgi:hypothetical protein